MKQMKKIVSLSMSLIAGLLFASCDLNVIHIQDAKWSYDEAYHWHACRDLQCSVVFEKAEHTFEKTVIDGKETVACSVCGMEQTDAQNVKTTVTEEEWQQAFLFTDNYELLLTQENESFTGYYLFKRQGDKFSVTVGADMGDGNVTESNEYYEQADGAVYHYYLRGDGTYQKSPERANTLEEALDNGWYGIYLPSGIRVLGEYSYNESKRVYTATDICGGSVIFQNIEIAFVNGKIVSITGNITNDSASMLMSIVYTVTYGNAEVVLPSLDNE